MRHIGVSNFAVAELRQIQQIAPVETLQPQYSLIERDVEREILELVDRLKLVADRYDTTAGAVAVAWTLRNPAVDGAIVGFRRPGQVDPILTAANLDLTDQDIAEIEGSTR